jgi:serine/threonine protein kinase/Flp pilus assembly protein TadD
VVWHARDQRDRSEVALKILARVTAASRERFHIETQATATLDHPNIVPLKDYGVVAERPFLAMSFVRGRSLREAKGLSIERAVTVVRDVALAVDYAHQEEVLHRDLKPDNVMLDEEGKVWVLDFGLAQLGESKGLTKTGDLIGTPAYMAPEQADGRGKHVDQRCDVYSLGAMLFHTLTGHSPFHECETVHAQLSATLFEEAPSPSESTPEVPKSLDWIVAKCLEKKPGRRYPSAAALAEDLENHLRGLPVRARPAPRRAPESSREQSKPGSVHLAAFAGVGLLIVIGVWLASRAGSPPPSSPSLSQATSPSPSPSPTASALPSQPPLAPGEADLLEARRLAKSGQVSSALQAASEALRQDAKLSEARDLRAELLASRKRWSAALEDLGVLIEGAPQSAELRLRRARVLSELEEFGQAEQDLEVARGIQESTEVFLLSGQVALARKEPRAALEHLSKVEGLDPDHPGLRRTRAAAYLATDDPRAEEDLVFVANKSPKDVEAAWALGDFYTARKKPELALGALRRPLERGVESAPLALAVAKIHEAAGRRADALRRFRDALAWDRGSSLAQAGIGRLTRSEATPAAARQTPTPAAPARDLAGEALVADLQAWASLLDEPWPALPIYAPVYAENWGPRLQEFKRATRGGSRVASAWINYGRALAAHERYAEAKDAFARSMVFEPDSPTAQRELGAVSLTLGQSKIALAYLSSCLDQRKRDGEAWRLFGIAALREQEGPRHARELEQALARHRSLRGLYRVVARAHVQRGQLAEAEAVVQRGLERSPKSRELLLERALARGQRGDARGALADLDASTAQRPSVTFNAWQVRFRVRLLARAGQLPEALELAKATQVREEAREPRTRALLGLVRALGGDPKGGSLDLDVAFKARPRPEYLLLRGLLRLKAGERAAARADLEAFCRKNRQHPKAIEIERYLDQ